MKKKIIGISILVVLVLATLAYFTVGKSFVQQSIWDDYQCDQKVTCTKYASCRDKCKTYEADGYDCYTATEKSSSGDYNMYMSCIIETDNVKECDDGNNMCTDGKVYECKNEKWNLQGTCSEVFPNYQDECISDGKTSIFVFDLCEEKSDFFCEDKETSFERKGYAVYYFAPTGKNVKSYDKCSGDVLLEQNCKGDIYSPIVHTCPNGCEDGACLPEEEPTTEYKCTDSDGGKDYGVKGTIIDKKDGETKGSSTDTCLDQDTLQEFYCETHDIGTIGTYEEYQCKCADGACIQDPVCGVEGCDPIEPELCATNNDCNEGEVCERTFCIPYEEESTFSRWGIPLIIIGVVLLIVALILILPTKKKKKR